MKEYISEIYVGKGMGNTELKVVVVGNPQQSFMDLPKLTIRGHNGTAINNPQILPRRESLVYLENTKIHSLSAQLSHVCVCMVNSCWFASVVCTLWINVLF